MRLTRQILAGLVLVCLAVAAQAVDYRLPPDIRPLSQDIELRVDPGEPAFTGRTRVRLSVGVATDRIGVYQEGLEFDSIRLGSDAGSRELAAEDGDYDMSWLSDGETIAAGEYTLDIEWSGRHATDSLGMHRVTFEGNDYVFTQFEDMYARRAIPLFDEPSFKIPYQLTIHAPAGLVVVSNTPVEAVEESDGWQTVRFMQTKPLPSYLLAYAVGPLDRAAIEGMSVPGYVYTPKGHAGELGFVLRETPQIVGALEEYFGSKYPYRKLDFIAVPEFAFGAMENPGLITYRTDLLLVGDEVSGSTAEAVLNVIAHEVAHIWYGDLVTMAWWDDLWLNEAFATWMSRSTLERIYPQYEPELKLPQGGAFGQDQQTSAKAIRKEVKTSEDVLDGLGLNYTKGHSILRMLEHYVGHSAWQEAIRRYLGRYAWSNATERDLWAVVSEVSGLDVGRIAGDYLNQPGFATVSVDEEGGVRQQRYMSYGRKAPELTWRIPMTVKYKHDGEVRQAFYLLEGSEGAIDLPEGTDWIYPDAGANGYYRWKTNLGQYYNLIEDADALSEREKIGLLDNTEALLNSGDLALADYLFTLGRFLRDPHPLVFLTALEKVKEIGDDFVDAGNRTAFARFVDESLGERFAAVGVDSRPGDSESVIQMRPRLMRMLGEYGSDPAARKAAREIAMRYLGDPAGIGSDLGREALRVTSLSDDGGLYPRYRQAYLESKSEDQKSNILTSIYFHDPDVIREHLDFTISPAVPAGDAPAGFALYASLLDDHAVLYEWLGENFDAFLGKIPAYYHGLLPQLASGGCNATTLGQLKAFFGTRGEQYALALGRAAEAIENCMGRREREREGLQQFLAQYRQD
ncbi:MAG: M1 family metallopeptidase [Gammaproteobacteria bacterium]|nr:M1 family metallopeptidase [Gammaproteobacteria bacterium]MDH4254529.1 M1 family metallopeptidase [Gammaproteobacteria bacterium]MDH5309573.1 M1 family metallopeptidase [Gammaproteobacteria bacterium]